MAVGMALSLLAFKKCLDNTLGHRVWILGGFGLWVVFGLSPCRPLLTHDILWFHVSGLQKFTAIFGQRKPVLDTCSEIGDKKNAFSCL